MTKALLWFPKRRLWHVCEPAVEITRPQAVLDASAPALMRELLIERLDLQVYFGARCTTLSCLGQAMLRDVLARAGVWPRPRRPAHLICVALVRCYRRVQAGAGALCSACHAHGRGPATKPVSFELPKSDDRTACAARKSRAGSLWLSLQMTKARSRLGACTRAAVPCNHAGRHGAFVEGLWRRASRSSRT